MATRGPIEVRFSEAMIPPNVAGDQLSELAALSKEQTRLVKEWLATARLTLSSKDNEESLTIALADKGSKELAAKVVSNYFSLESLRRALDWLPEDFVKHVTELYDEQGAEEKKSPFDEDCLAMLIDLFSPTEQVDLLYKARRIYDGCLPSFADCYTTVDFRPVFSGDKDLAVHHGLITTVLEFVVRKPDETAETQRLALQIDLEDICQLESVLARAKSKISHLRQLAEAEDKIRLFNPRAGLIEESKK